jgi:uncharacterized protein (DUF2235 family)
MKRKLIVLFDGTWNSPKDETNVTKIKECLDSIGKDDAYQPYFYDTGVGTHFYDKLTGGAFGRGLSVNIMQGYKWLCETYKDGDEIFTFGFSRGAYTARSLVGLIRKCGLLNDPKLSLILQAYDLYRDKDVHPNDKEAVAFRRSFSREVRIKFIGVWDTVGALGIPLSHVPFGRDYFQWHDLELSKIVDYAYHAVALDEHRKDYMATMWAKIKPQNKDVEQRWFIGAHADVGGGYKDDPLRTIPCKWIATKAKECGLKFKEEIGTRENDFLAPVHDSYSDFMFGIYKLVKHEYYRPIGTGVNETIDESVWKRWEHDQSYRPVSLNSGSRSSIEELLKVSAKDTDKKLWDMES